MLDKLYQWFNQTRNTTVKMAVKEQKEEYKPPDVEWEIRNTFKSTLPLEYFAFYLESECIGAECFGTMTTMPKTSRLVAK
jgi:hypothetical protein